MSTRFSLTGLSPSLAGFPKTILLSSLNQFRGPKPQGARALVWALPVPLAATPGIILIFSSSGYLDVSVHRVPLHNLWIQLWIHEVSSCGFPHSEISGSLDICSSPKLFAAYHVFHRLLVPRHPPCALSSITNWIENAVSKGLITRDSVSSYSPFHGAFFNLTYIALYVLVDSFKCLHLVFTFMSFNMTSDVLIFLSVFLICGFQGTLSDLFRS